LRKLRNQNSLSPNRREKLAADKPGFFKNDFIRAHLC
jgi:hypothetical protein